MSPNRSAGRTSSVVLWLSLAAAVAAVFWIGLMWGRRAPGPDEPAISRSAPMQLHAQLDAAGVPWIRDDAGVIEIVPTPEGRRRWRVVYQQLASAVSVTRSSELLWFGAASPAALRPPAQGWLMLVLDDVGFHPERVRQMLSWPVPLVFAVLPRRPFSTVLATEIVAAGHDLMLHQPMEPMGYPVDNPGTYALLISDGEQRWTQLLRENLDGLPGVQAVNNHMGSRFTADRAAMLALMRVLKERRLMFLDSLTTPKTQAFDACRTVGVLCMTRDIFLDHERTDAFVAGQIDRWLERSRRQGVAIAIGHPYAVTLKQVGAAIAQTRQHGYRWIGLDQMYVYLRKYGLNGDDEIRSP